MEKIAKMLLTENTLIFETFKGMPDWVLNLIEHMINPDPERRMSVVQAFIYL